MNVPSQYGRLMLAALVVVGLSVPGTVYGQSAEAPRESRDSVLARRVNDAVTRVLEQSGVPSISVAIVRNGELVLARAWGSARLEPRVAATPDTRYGIGSISKQFIAAAILLLQQQGRLSLDDRVRRFLPELTGGDSVTVRQLLAHTAGYPDYWPHKYVPSYMLEATDVKAILADWGRRPLSAAPGTKWLYSNTNYVIAGAIVEKVSGMSLIRFLHRHIFGPLGMTVRDFDEPRRPVDAAEYTRYALGPRIPATMGKGWLFAAASLVMTAKDLARWDQSIMERSLLDSASYREMETEVHLPDGSPTRMGLGFEVGRFGPRRMMFFSGGTAGFSAINYVFPDDRTALVVLTNEQPSEAVGFVSNQLLQIVFSSGGANANQPRAALAEKPYVPPRVNCSDPNETIRGLLVTFQRGAIDRARFTAEANRHFSERAMAVYASSLAPLGAPTGIFRLGGEERSGMFSCQYRVLFGQRAVSIATLEMPDGKFEQFQVFAAPPYVR